ncbi:MAG: hypothetical protein AABY22_15180, partial [Nanoarchaeota archaeon]
KRVTDCEPAENGVVRCRIATKTKKGMYATGDDFSFGIDENCQGVPFGRQRISAENKDLVDETIKSAETACRRGIREG